MTVGRKVNRPYRNRSDATLKSRIGTIDTIDGPFWASSCRFERSAKRAVHPW